MDKVQVLMSSYNGEKYIEEQIDSILKQVGIDIQLFIRDDGSTDKTIQIIRKKSREYPKKIQLVCGHNIGYKKSFMDLVYMCPDSYDYYAFADQDDVWLKDKIQKGIEQIKKEDSKYPVLYYGMMTQVDNKLRVMKDQQNFKAVPNYKMILFQNFAQGSTIIFNNSLLVMIKKYKANFEVAHDIWLPLVADFTGKVIGDKNSYILYRRHSSAVTVKMHNKYWYDLIKAIFRGKIVPNYAIPLLEGYSGYISSEKKEYLKQLLDYKKYNNKLNLLLDKMVRKNTLKGTILLKMAIMFNRLDDKVE